MTKKIDRIVEICFQVFLTLAIFNGGTLVNFSWMGDIVSEAVKINVFFNFIFSVVLMVIFIFIYISRGEEDKEINEKILRLKQFFNKKKIKCDKNE